MYGCDCNVACSHTTPVAAGAAANDTAKDVIYIISGILYVILLIPDLLRNEHYLINAPSLKGIEH